MLALLLTVPGLATAAERGVFGTPLARPSDRLDPNRHTYALPEAPHSPACTRHFCVHWVAEGRDAPKPVDVNGVKDSDGVPDFVERVQRVAEYVRSVENGKLGWREPRSDGREGGRKDRTDVYLKQLGGIGGAFFGYAVIDPNQASKGGKLPRRLHGYLVLDNNYARSEFPGTKPNEDLEVTFAHEYAHILQLAYDAHQGAWFAESSAVWMEDQVYDEINDYLRYVGRWVKLFATPLTATSAREYGSVVWNDWLTQRYGEGIVRKAWAGAIDARPSGFSVSSYERAIRASGGGDFSHDFARFARDLAEWHIGKAFSESGSYPDVSRQGNLPAGGRVLDRALNHTTFQMLRVHVRGGRAVVVRAQAPQGVAAAIALVGRIGSERQGQVVSQLTFRQNGGRMAVGLSQPGRFDRITAVMVNADTRATGFSPRLLDWNYLTDTAPFRVRADVVR